MTTNKKKNGVITTPAKISIRLTEDQREWLDTKSNKSAYICELIDDDIVHDQHEQEARDWKEFGEVD